MGPSKYRIAEECMRLLAGGRVGSGSKWHIREIIISVAQVANQLLKIEYMQTNMPMGEMIPSGCCLGQYDNLPAVKYKNVSAITLPVAPIRLPRDMGCFSIFPTDDPSAEFIPLQNGQENLILSQGLLSQIGGSIGYTRYGLLVQLTADITIPNVVVNVSARLAVLDFTAYNDYAPLPLTADHEWAIKKEVVQLYGGEPIPDKLVDPGVKESRNIPVNKQSQS
jgi:hypothetical protein